MRKTSLATGRKVAEGLRPLVGCHLSLPPRHPLLPPRTDFPGPSVIFSYSLILSKMSLVLRDWHSSNKSNPSPSEEGRDNSKCFLP
ncbi:hypothetical protein NPIL_12441 [Nephila pilipes]|uniref:Uncharacterized protein n=1 Tax=Nephila pilipes TaxID=299642 RepID=A0A8X6TR66_NEPPI|nr:hypothetical protein NPIL_12441 [Nephila pilipes]